MPDAHPKDNIKLLRQDYRHHLEQFYAALNLAPPYHSIEKAITHLSASLKTKTADEQARIATDESLKWALYRVAFVESGLNKKHRGIIAGLARSPNSPTLPKEYQHFLEPFIS